jgi:enhancing lycopene biosynthesis protein 2
VARLLRELHAAGKPIGALCIAPAVLARVFGADLHPELTIGTDAGTAKALETMGAKHRNAGVDEVVVDRKNKFVTTACYMLAGRISEVAVGAEKVVKAVLELA